MVFPAPFIKEPIVYNEYAYLLCQIIADYISVVLFLALNSPLLIDVCIFTPIPHYFDYYSFVI